MQKKLTLIFMLLAVFSYSQSSIIKGRLLDKNTNAEIIKIDILKEYETDYGYQILPRNDKGDGFYYCLIKKVF